MQSTVGDLVMPEFHIKYMNTSVIKTAIIVTKPSLEESMYQYITYEYTINIAVAQHHKKKESTRLVLTGNALKRLYRPPPKAEPRSSFANPSARVNRSSMSAFDGK